MPAKSCYGFKAEEPCIKLNERSVGFIWQNKQTWEKKTEAIHNDALEAHINVSLFKKGSFAQTNS